MGIDSWPKTIENEDNRRDFLEGREGICTIGDLSGNVTMMKCPIVVFSPDKDSARMLRLYFESRDYIVMVKMLEMEWSKDYVRDICEREMPRVIIVWDSITSPVLSVYHDLKANPLTADITVVLILAAWPKGFTELPDYLFVHPFDISHVEAFVRKSCQ